MIVTLQAVGFEAMRVLHHSACLEEALEIPYLEIDDRPEKQCLQDEPPADARASVFSH